MSRPTIQPVRDSLNSFEILPIRNPRQISSSPNPAVVQETASIRNNLFRSWYAVWCLLRSGSCRPVATKMAPSRTAISLMTATTAIASRMVRGQLSGLASPSSAGLPPFSNHRARITSIASGMAINASSSGLTPAGKAIPTAARSLGKRSMKLAASTKRMVMLMPSMDLSRNLPMENPALFALRLLMSTPVPIRSCMYGSGSIPVHLLLSFSRLWKNSE